MCGKCFAVIPLAAESCPDCGAPLSTSVSSDGDASALLAHANLLRMRGDLKAAEDACLKILHRYPYNASAHALLGEIAFAKGDLEQAIQWFELTLDIVPDSRADQRRLDEARAALRDRALKQAEVETGVKRQRTPWVALVAVVATVAVVSWAIGNRMGSKAAVPTETPAALKPIVLQDLPGETPRVTAPSASVPIPAPDPAPVPVDLRQQLAQRIGMEVARIASAQVESDRASIGYVVGDSTDWIMKAQLAYHAFAVLPQVGQVVVYSDRNGMASESNTVLRRQYDEANTDAFREQNPDFVAGLVRLFFGGEASTPADPGMTSNEGAPGNSRSPEVNSERPDF